MSNQIGFAKLSSLLVLFIVLRSSNAISSSGLCPDKWAWSSHSRTCVKLFRSTLYYASTWDEARTNCQKDGGEMAVILNEYIETLVVDYQNFVTSDSLLLFYYIGWNFLGKREDFGWFGVQSKVDYACWDAEQFDVTSDHVSYCVPLSKTILRRICRAISCNLNVGYICEKLSVMPKTEAHNDPGHGVTSSMLTTPLVKKLALDKQIACGKTTFGPNCTQHCSQNCAGADKSCDFRNGTCIQGCVVGYKEPRCDKACGNNTFGQNCTQDCSRNCAGPDKSCDYRNGACIQGCVVGYKEPRCNEACGNNTFGQNCAQDCSRNCAGPDKSCDHRNGACSQGCVVGFKAPKCIEACDPGRFGQNCSQQCTSNCAGTCMATNGWCIDGCQDGFTGAYCESRSDDILNLSQQTMSISLLIAVAVCMGLILLCYFIPAGHTKRKASDSLNFQHGHDDALSETTAAKPLRVNYEKENNAIESATKTNAIDSSSSIAQPSSMGSMSYSESSISERSSSY